MGKFVKNRRLTAMTADKYRLYEESVQGVEADEEFIKNTFKKLFQRPAKSLKEDFSGTALLAVEWVKAKKGRTAIAVDLDEEVIEWARVNRREALPTKVRTALTLMQEDVRVVHEPRVDVVAALNFSYWVFKVRTQLLNYLKNCYRSLNDQGIVVLDVFSGSEAAEVKEEQREYDRFTYVWDQESYNPVTANLIAKIHFHFNDGSKMENAFVYDWRVWSVAELMELLVEAGFEAKFFYRASDDEGGLTGETEETTQIEDDLTWLAFVVGVKDERI
jgi:cyclopropane fatty-acyl-phospholipid synthase-like methyltransferase